MFLFFILLCREFRRRVCFEEEEDGSKRVRFFCEDRICCCDLYESYWGYDERGDGEG